MKQAIIGYHKDEENDWVAELGCGHFQHVRHNPPWSERPWTESQKDRSAMIGFMLDCKKCDEGAPADQVST